MSKKNTIFAPKPKIWETEEPSVMNKTVKRVISGNTFETNDGQIVTIHHVVTPPENRANFHKAKKDLEKLLRRNTHVKIKPIGETKTGMLIAKVRYKSGDVGIKMIDRGWGNKEIKTKSILSEKVRWHEKYKK